MFVAFELPLATFICPQIYSIWSHIVLQIKPLSMALKPLALLQSCLWQNLKLIRLLVIGMHMALEEY